MKQKNMNASCSKGIVYKKTFGSYEVHQGEKVISCLLSSHLRKELSYAEPAPNSHRGRVRKVKFNDDVDPVAVGDEVAFLEAQDGTAVIIDVLPRRTKLNRKTAVPMPSARPFEQIIVANLDQVVPVFAAANPKPKWALLDRYLVSAESLDLPVLICITKLDLVQGRDCVKDELPEGELREMVAEYRRIGYPVVLVSSLTGDGLEELRQAFQRRASVLVGKSGVGKSSLLNALQPGLGLKVNEVSRVSGKGKHTTSHMEMFDLDFGGTIVDTPGVQEFGLWDVREDDLALFFPEIRPYLGSCKFGLGCQHENEPGCEVRQAVAEGKISSHRFYSYKRLKMEG